MSIVFQKHPPTCADETDETPMQAHSSPEIQRNTPAEALTKPTKPRNQGEPLPPGSIVWTEDDMPTEASPPISAEEAARARRGNVKRGEGWHIVVRRGRKLWRRHGGTARGCVTRCPGLIDLERAEAAFTAEIEKVLRLHRLRHARALADQSRAEAAAAVAARVLSLAALPEFRRLGRGMAGAIAKRVFRTPRHVREILRKAEATENG